MAFYDTAWFLFSVLSSLESRWTTRKQLPTTKFREVQFFIWSWLLEADSLVNQVSILNLIFKTFKLLVIGGSNLVQSYIIFEFENPSLALQHKNGNFSDFSTKMDDWHRIANTSMSVLRFLPVNVWMVHCLQLQDTELSNRKCAPKWKFWKSARILRVHIRQPQLFSPLFFFADSRAMSYQLYRNTTLGNTLQEALDELMQVWSLLQY